MSNKTQEQLDNMFTQSRLKKERQKQREIEKRRKEKLQLKKAKQLMQKTLLKIKKIEEEKEKKKQEKIERKKLYSPSYYYFKIYRTNLIERDTTEEDLYNTWDEIKEAEERNEGKLNWTTLQRIINDTKTMLNQSI